MVLAKVVVCALSTVTLSLLTWNGLASAQKLPARWINVHSIDCNVVGMKKEIAIDADTARKLFVKDFPHLRENWQKEIRGQIETATDAKAISEAVKKVGINPRDTQACATVLRFSDTELIVLVVEHKGQYLWHHYYECQARLRIPRDKETDAIFDVPALAKTYGAELKGLKQGDPVEAVTDNLGKPDAIIHYQAADFYKICYFRDDVVISINCQRIERFDFGVPDNIKEEAKKHGPELTRF